MSIKSLIGVGACILSISGCTADRPATRDLPPGLAVLPVGQTAPVRSYTIQDVVVLVPRDLTSTESGSYYPLADIVWRGDPIGDRHAQVGALFESAAARASPDIKGDVPVIAVISLVRFHGVTERTRYSVGGVYHMVFQVQVQDARTGIILEEARVVEASLPAPGGQAAIELDRIGQTERVRVIDYLTFVLRRELGADVTPGAPEAIETFL